jgi:hypothetical protein
VHLGGAACTLARYVDATRRGSRQEVAEPDGALLDLARAHLGLRTSPALRVRVLDGRTLLERRRPGAADLVVLDAFVGTDVPAQLADAGAVAAAGGRCARTAPSRPTSSTCRRCPAARALGRLLAAAFPHLAVVATRKVVRGRQGGNVVLLASAAPLPEGACAPGPCAGRCPSSSSAGTTRGPGCGPSPRSSRRGQRLGHSNPVVERSRKTERRCARTAGDSSAGGTRPATSTGGASCST